ncbi:MAG: alpha-glucosidase C-terminal domain-containing protein [Bacteroidota bacterium]
MYQGDELGMANVAFDSIEEYDDVEAKNYYQEQTTGKDASTQQAVLQKIQRCGRDNARTSMQWDDSPHGGFTTGTPWLKVNPNFKTINAEQQQHDPDSILSYYKKILRLRKENPVLVYGEYESLLPEDEHLYVYRRWDENELFYVVLNFSGSNQTLDLPQSQLSPVINNYASLTKNGRQISLQPWQAIIFNEK